MSGDGASENYGDPSLAGALPPNSRSWDDTDDVRLREALERGDGKKTWSQIARDAFPNGDFGKVECQAVRSSRTSGVSLCPRRTSSHVGAHLVGHFLIQRTPLHVTLRSNADLICTARSDGPS